MKMSFEEKERLALQWAKTDEGIRNIMKSMNVSNELVFETLQKHRNDGPMLVLAITCFSVVG